MENANDNPKQALIDKLKESKSILVTVSSSPSVDQLAACIALTIWLNKADKHATAVFSGDVPSTLEFLEPAETLEKNTDSLRDFIISLDKSKADKLRYKVEDAVVKIFITPYRTSLSADDLEYSQGDFNVDTVVALGVNDQADLDTAITSHGRILHDATVATITTGEAASQLGSISWHDPHASSLSELVMSLGDGIDHQQLDNQIATALLTGIVAETERFSNDKTSPQTMSVSAALMSAGANQQLVVSKLEAPVVEPAEPAEPAVEAESDDQPSAPNDGSLEIEHEDGEAEHHEDEHVEENTEQEDFTLPEPSEQVEEPEEQAAEEVEETAPEGESEQPEAETEPEPETKADDDDGQQRVTEPPEMGGTLTANAEPEDVTTETTPDILSQHTDEPPAPLLDHDNDDEQGDTPQEMQPAPPTWMPPQPWMDPAAPAPADNLPFTPAPDETLAQIEHDVDSPHIAEEIALEEAVRPDLDSARDEVMKAIESEPAGQPEAIQALNAQPIDLSMPETPAAGELNLPPAPTPSAAFDPTAFLRMNDAPAAVPEQPMEPPVFPASDDQVDPDLTTPVAQPFTMPLPSAPTPQPTNPTQSTPVVNDPSAPPPVPPPLPFTPNSQQ